MASTTNFDKFGQPIPKTPSGIDRIGAAPAVYYWTDKIVSNRGLIHISELKQGDRVHGVDGITEVVGVRKVSGQSTSVNWDARRNNHTVFASEAKLILTSEAHLKDYVPKSVLLLEEGDKVPMARVRPGIHDRTLECDPYTFGAWFSMGEIMDNFLPMHPDSRDWYEEHGATIPPELMYGPVEDRMAFAAAAMEWGLSRKSEKYWSVSTFCFFGWHVKHEHPNPQGDRAMMMAELFLSLGARVKYYPPTEHHHNLSRVEIQWVIDFWSKLMVKGGPEELGRYYGIQVHDTESAAQREWFLPVTKSGTALVGVEMLAIDAR